MLSHIEVENYQSIKQASLPLGRFTVIVGQTDSGKSALTRAIKTLTSNTRGDSFITTGERLTVIKAITDRGTVILRRGTDNDYTITPDSHPEARKTFTKLNAQVPEEVSAFLGIAAKDPINFAGQFDTPYLLKSTGSEVARVLGELTNVDVIFRAAAESNKRRRTAASTLKTRSEDLTTLLEQVEEYRTLTAQREAIAAAQKALARAAHIEEQLHQLSGLITTIQGSMASLNEANKILTTPVPDMMPILNAQLDLQAFTTTIEKLQQAAAAIKAATIVEQEAVDSADSLMASYDAILIEAGTCPTCSQDTTHLVAHSDYHQEPTA